MLLDDRELEQLADLLAEKLDLRRPPRIAPRLMDIEQTAVYLGRSPLAVRHMIAKGTLPTTKLDGKVQIDRSILDRLIEARTE